MNCGYCAEFCPFDAIKMDHDYELASYERTTAHIHDKERLSKPVSYWRQLATKKAAAEEAARQLAEQSKGKRRGPGAKDEDVPTLSDEQAQQLPYRGAG
jgi:NADH-quinone oxidoreductase subunit I